MATSSSAITAAYAAVLLLHPGRRRRYIRDNWRKMLVQPAMDAVEDLWATTYRDRTVKDEKERIPALAREPNAFNCVAKLLQLNLNDGELDIVISQSPIRLPKGTTAFNLWLDSHRR
ncbi:hypothetical protein GGR57DRAFT_516184 [Xylariaceae sp. FL1272]|nr:hypothetical protein GGR57DRAFT_516184 [Xylariaceae sp. FL1272]